MPILDPSIQKPLYFPPNVVREMRQADASTADSQFLLSLASEIKSHAEVPFSKFFVGAAAFGESGAVYCGVNIEFSGTVIGQSIHAEQCLILNAVLHGETALKLISVTESPCGHCRQFMCELSKSDDLRIFVPNCGVSEEGMLLSEWLPMRFGPEALVKGVALLTTQFGAVSLSCEEPAPIIAKACEIASFSYSPYTKSPSAVVLETADAKYCGPYVESAAYNPSMPPFQAASIAMMVSTGKLELGKVQRVCLVERATEDRKDGQESVVQKEILQMVVQKCLPEADFVFSKIDVEPVEEATSEH